MDTKPQVKTFIASFVNRPMNIALAEIDQKTNDLDASEILQINDTYDERKIADGIVDLHLKRIVIYRP